MYKIHFSKSFPGYGTDMDTAMTNLASLVSLIFVGGINSKLTLYSYSLIDIGSTANKIPDI